MAPSTKDKRLVSIPPEVAQAVDERVGSRGFSAYVSEATAQRLRRDAAAELLAAVEAIHGPTDPADVSRLKSVFG
ncbi:MAG: CopG family transcriptional regulator [Cellulomonadaceae bacterium]|nr:CopG family transcriptional regulator [Cellulomonadaceae bacterium]